MSGEVLHRTKGIVLKSVAYGDTSLIVTVFTELFGTQSYLMQGVRTSKQKGTNKASYFQIGSMLELVVYHKEFKNLQRVKEYRWSYLYKNIFFDVIKNCVAQYMVELLQKLLKQPEPNPELFYFIEDAFIHLDEADSTTLANYPIFFATHLPFFFGFRINDSYTQLRCVLDLKEGSFETEIPHHPSYITEPYSSLISQFLKVQHPKELEELKMNVEKRRMLLAALEEFYQHHLHEFGTLKSLSVLKQLL